MKGELRQEAALRLVQKVIASGEECFLFPLGNSMSPFICSQDKITLKRTKGEDIAVGDIVLCQSSNNRFFIHRVICKSYDNRQITLLTKGDAMLSADPPISASNVLAKVIAVQKNARSLSVETESVRRLNWWIAHYFYGLHLLLRRLSCLKTVLVGDEKNSLLNFCATIFRKSSLFPPILLLKLSIWTGPKNVDS